MSQKKLAAVTAVSQGSTAPEYQSETMIYSKNAIKQKQIPAKCRHYVTEEISSRYRCFTGFNRP